MIPLSELIDCIKTLNQAADLYMRQQCPPAIEGDGFGAVIEAKRNLLAMIKFYYGKEVWEGVQDL